MFNYVPSMCCTHHHTIPAPIPLLSLLFRDNKMLRLQQVMYLSLAEENFEQDCQVEKS